MRTFNVIQRLAEQVMITLGTGHSENIYHRALMTALNKSKIPHRSEVPCPIYFMDECIGFGRADLVLDDYVIEIKATKVTPASTSAQLRKYLTSLRNAEKKHYIGVIINFNQKKEQVDIIIDPQKSSRFFEKQIGRAHV